MDKMRAQVGTDENLKRCLQALGKQALITAPVQHQLLLTSLLVDLMTQEAAGTISLFTFFLNVQAERWGSELLTEDVEHVDLSNRPFTVRTSDTEVLSPLLPGGQLSTGTCAWWCSRTAL